MNRHTVIYLLLAACIAFQACKPQVPRQFIQPAEMEDLLYDYHVADAMALNTKADDEQPDYKRQLYFEAVLKKHGVTKAEFDSSLVYYYTRSDRFQGIYQRVVKRLSDDALSLGASEGEVSRFLRASAHGDTANVWTGNAAAVLIPYAPHNRMDFSQQADTSYYKGDTFMLRFNVNFLYQNGTKDALACLVLTYDNDSVVCQTRHISNEGEIRLHMPEVKDLRLRSLCGFIWLGMGSDDSNTLKIMLIKDLQLIRFHHNNHGKQDTENSSTSPADADGRPGAFGRLDTVRRDSGRLLPPDRRAAFNRVAGGDSAAPPRRGRLNPRLQQ